MKVIIAGGRAIDDYRLVKHAVEVSGFTITEVVSGGAQGVDSLGEMWAALHHVPLRRFPAAWDDIKAPGAKVAYRNGRPYNLLAGFWRNEDMAKYGEGLILVWTGSTKGSADMLHRARRHGLLICDHRV